MAVDRRAAYAGLQRNGVVNAAICTLFEGDYHYGVACLVNSLCRSGFSGTIYAGYRGEIPPWSGRLKPLTGDNPTRCFNVTDQVTIKFLPLTTNCHLTNYKPDFMLSLMEGEAAEADAIFYFDPDITVMAPWSFFEDWVRCGIALCEDVNSPLSENHPRRAAWRRHYEPLGMVLTHKTDVYLNGGFQGVDRSDIAFLRQWRDIQLAMAPLIGGLDKSGFGQNSALTDPFGSSFAFNRTDQDALNIAAQSTDRAVSIMGKDAMGFVPATCVMSHALGHLKPWNTPWLRTFIAGRSPSVADRHFWEVADKPVCPFSMRTVQLTRMKLAMGAVLGRFYARG